MHPLKCNGAGLTLPIKSVVLAQKYVVSCILCSLSMVYIIGNVVVGEGCQVKINGNTPVTFGVTGIQLVPETAPFNIPVGWSIITYLRTSPGDMVTLMAPITAANLYKRIS